MGLIEASVPKKYRSKFTAAVAARRTINAKRSMGKAPTPAEVNRDYKAMNALPLWLQPIADRRAR